MKMTVYKCPKCGAVLQTLVYATYPPINAWVCTSCDWRYEEKQDAIEYVPFSINAQHEL